MEFPCSVGCEGGERGGRRREVEGGRVEHEGGLDGWVASEGERGEDETRGMPFG